MWGLVWPLAVDIVTLDVLLLSIRMKLFWVLQSFHCTRLLCARLLGPSAFKGNSVPRAHLCVCVCLCVFEHMHMLIVHPGRAVYTFNTTHSHYAAELSVVARLMLILLIMRSSLLPAVI